jgi:two-component system invasion response regulator UvrY
MKDIKIIIVDDYKLVRESWGILLNQTPGFSVIAQFENGHAAIEKVNELDPDIILVDINMSSMNGYETTQELLKNYPSLKVIGISISNQPQVATKMMNAGAKGYITKSSSLQEIVNAIHEVYNGNNYICEEIRKRMN